MKRILSLVLAMVMVLGSFTAVFAAEQTAAEKAGAFLQSVEVLRGTNADGDLNLPEDLKREEAIIVLSRLMKVEEEAKAFSTENLVFDDITNNSYKGYISWAYDNGYTTGTSATKFGFKKSLSAQDFATFVLRALGYEVTGEAYKVALETAQELGLLADLDVANKTVMTRGMMAVMTFNGLGVKVKDSEKTLAEVLEIAMPVPAEVTMTLAATGAKKLEVKFSKEVDTTKAVVTAKKGTVVVNTDKVTFAEDKMSVVLTTTTNLTKGDYTVSVAGLTEEALVATVTVEDVKVTKINITSDKAPINPLNNKEAFVSFEVLNQYGEKMTESINWTASTGVTPTASGSTLTITVAGGATAQFIPGAIVYVTGVHTTSGTVVNSQVEVVLAAHSNEVVFKGVYELATEKLVDLKAGFAADKFVLLYEVKDQYGNKIVSPTFADLVFTSNNPLFVSTPDTAATAVTVDGVSYQAVKLVGPLATSGNGGTVTIQAISKFTGKISTFTIQADAKASLKSFNMSAPSVMVTEGETVEIPFVAVDQYGNAITKYAALNGKITLSPAAALASDTGLRFVENNDGTAKLTYKAPTTGASDNADLPVYLTSVVPAGNFSSLMISVKEQARPVSIVGLAAAKVTSIAAGNLVSFKAEDLLIQDQYGRTMGEDINDWLSASNSIVVTSTAGSAFDVKLNLGTDNVKNVIVAGTDKIHVVANSDTALTETLTFKLSVDGGTNQLDSSAKSIVFTKVLKSSFVSYEVADLGTMYNNATATGATHTDYNKKVTVYGVLSNGTKVALPASDYSVSAGLKLNTTTPGAIADVATGGYEVAAFTNLDGTFKNVKVAVLVTVNLADGSAAAIIEKELLLSNEDPKVTTVALDVDENDKEFIGYSTTAGAIEVTDLTALIDVVKDQYGVNVKANMVLNNPIITITNVTKVTGSTLTVSANGTTTTSITGVKQGDKFTVTFKFASGVSAKADLTVGLMK